MRKQTVFVGLFAMLVALAVMANSCEVDMKRVRLGDLSDQLKEYKDTKWDGLGTNRVKYAVSGNDEVDAWSKQSGVTYASLVQAQHVAATASKDLKKLKQEKNVKSAKEAEKNVKLAKDILEKAAENAPKLITQGKKFAENYKSLINDIGKAPQILQATKDSITNLSKTVEEAPKTIKKLGNIAKELADL
jgi:hypothetical protein